MEFLQIAILSLVSFAVLFLLSKLMGYRAISELSFFDYVVAVTIGSIAAEMSTNIDIEWWKGITAMCIYAFIDIIFSLLSQKSRGARRLIAGTPIVLVSKGKVIKKSLKKARIEIDDLVSAARIAGYFNLADVDWAIMENNGQISFLPVPLKRPLNPKDFNFAPQSDGVPSNVIMDGKIVEDELTRAGITKKELIRQVRRRGHEVQDVFFANIDSNGVLTIFDR
ncbi:MAG: DUF421 domain-containing protein [Clostridiales bacterium]|nr:DUF421 domain-containing protein [Clostridiales bacterium]